MSLLCKLALAKGKKGLALGRSYHLAKRTQMLHERELTQHLHRAGVCRFIPACRGHVEESLRNKDVLTTHLVPKFCGESQGARLSSLTRQVQDPALWGWRSRAAESLWCRYTGSQTPQQPCPALPRSWGCAAQGAWLTVCPAVPVCVHALGSLCGCLQCLRWETLQLQASWQAFKPYRELPGHACPLWSCPYCSTYSLTR